MEYIFVPRKFEKKKFFTSQRHINVYSPYHINFEMEFIIVSHGTVTMNIQGETYRISKGQGSTSEWTYATDEVIINTVKAFRTQDSELLKTKEEIKVEAVDNNLQVDLAAALIANRCRYSYVAYKNREEVDCYMVTFYLSKNRRFKVSLTKDDETTQLINA